MKKITVSKINQEKMLEYMAKVMSLVEQEDFSLVSADVCASWYTLIPQNIVTGKVHIIANKEYMKKFEIIKKIAHFAPYEEYSFTIGEFDKVLLLKSKLKRNKHNEPKYSYVFKRSKTIMLSEQKGYSFKRYPYLNAAMNLLNSDYNISGNDLDASIEKAIQLIKQNPEVLNEKPTPRIKTLEKSIFNQLNGIKSTIK